MPDDQASAWPQGNGEMAARIRAHDWATTPLGPIEIWPQSLKATIDLMLACGHAMQIAWGSERTVLYNDAYAPMLVDRHPDALGMSFRDVWFDVWDEIEPLVDRVFAGETVRFEAMPLLMTRRGYPEDTWWTFSYSSVQGEAGEIAGLLNVPVDATARVRGEQAEAALRESEARHRLLIGSWAQAVWESDPHGVVSADSPSWRAYTGQSLEEWRGYGWLNAIHPDDRAHAEQHWREAIAARKFVDAEFRLRAPDGGWRWTNVRAAPVLDAAGNIEKWAGMNIDIHARRVTEAKLRASEETYRTELERRVEEATADLKASRDLLQATLDASTDMIQVFEAIRDEAGEIADFRWVLNNHTSESRYGEVRGESLLTRNPGVVVEGIFDAFKKVTETGVPEQAERHYAHEQFDGWFYQSVIKLNDGVATTTKDITDWKAAQVEVLRLRDEAAERTLTASRERLRGFGDASTDVLWIRDADTLGWTYLTPAFETIYGLPREEALIGNDFSNWVDLIVAEDRENAVALVQRVLRGESVAFEYRIRRPSDGAIRWLRDTDFPIRDAEGRITAIGGVGRDVTREKEANRIIRESRQQLETLVEGMAQLVWRSVDCGHWTWSSTQWSAFTGLSREASNGRGWLNALHPGDREHAMDAWRQAERGQDRLDVEYRVRHAETDAYRWFQTRALPVREDGNGRIVEWLGTSTDIDDLRQMQEAQGIMVAELQHRTRNLIAVVSSIARQTMAETGPTEAFRAAFADRMEALSRVQGLLSQAGDERVTVRKILDTEFAAHGADRLSGKVWLDGPEVPLRKSIVQTLALALHELVTNACKYGALAGEGGNLLVHWTTSRAENEERRLFLEWIESGIAIEMEGGEAVTQGGGYGRRLIEKSLPYTLRARTTYDLRPDGLRCTIDLPLTKPILKDPRS
ncbi:PAS domain-containing protein [Aureimonas psammosilenae]|uniref:PAS domain-containing protein n=1 Tax=Aureimonas psammosilenae TaxID=2495496 RepID=UPI001260489C|nr:PAS domain-containing protein [Aureimonas psammosilenae]